MARGIVRSGRTTTNILTALIAQFRMAAATRALAAMTLLALGACAEQSAEPTAAPAPTLVAITATAGPPPVPTPGEQQIYVVQEGDTLSAIASRFGVSEDAILKLNPLTDRDRLFVGQELVIPPAQP
jgi:LysM repeat protein